jgi:N-acetylglutamate synthase-like GNAT family acetyltransferase
MLSATTFDSLPPTSAASLVTFRPATAADVWALTALIVDHAGVGQLLPRSAGDIRHTLATWIVAEVDGTLAGCGSLSQTSPSRRELRSLVVRSGYRGYGIGAAIVRQLVARAWNAEAQCVYTLTRAVPFFARPGFHVTDRANLPEKIASDCIFCPLRAHCNETAMWLHRCEERRWLPISADEMLTVEAFTLSRSWGCCLYSA